MAGASPGKNLQSMKSCSPCLLPSERENVLLSLLLVLLGSVGSLVPDCGGFRFIISYILGHQGPCCLACGSLGSSPSPEQVVAWVQWSAEVPTSRVSKTFPPEFISPQRQCVHGDWGL